MKKFVLLVIFTIPLMAFCQSCCVVSATEAFADLGKQEKFQKMHDEPVPFDFLPQGADITFPVNGGAEGRAYVIRAAKPTFNYLFVFHEWWGLNDHIRLMGETFFEDLGDVTVVCLDLYDGKFTADRDEASALMSGANEERVRAIIDGAINYVGPRAQIATVGWCFGGGWSLQAAIAAHEQAVGCVVYYGMPEKDEVKLSQLEADVLGIFASKDGWITPKVVKEFENTMISLEKNVDVVTFDADHAFANPSSKKHDKKAAKQAYDIVLEFLQAHFNG